MTIRRLIAVDCETDPFQYERIPQPFIWGAYDGKRQIFFDDTEEFARWLAAQNAIAYAHNGGKFDFMYLLRFISYTRARIISGRIAEMTFGKCKLRDSFSIIPVAMKQIQKTEIEYWKMEREVRADHMPEIRSYLADDCRYLWQMVDTYRKAAGSQLTIASNALQSARKLGVNPGKTNFRFDREFREYYFGGRTQAFQPGTHKNLEIVDIVSSYPYAMIREHATGTERATARGASIKKVIGKFESEAERGRAFFHLRCFSTGAFPKRNEKTFGLDFPKEYGDYFVTGWELNAAEKHGLLKDVEIQAVTTFQDTIDFSPYIEKWFAYKAAHDKKTDPINYTIGKIMQNSLYGKLAQDPTRYYDYEIHEPGTPVKREEGWELYTENFLGVEIHRRSAKWNLEKKYGDEWEMRGIFYNVASGASITGFARAHLLDAIHTVGEENVIYCDTDSLILHKCDLSGLRIGKKLGEWESEGDVEIGHVAGKKLYAMRLAERDKDGKPKYKIASKGSKLDFEQMKALTEGKTVTWKSEAPTFSLANGIDFVQREIRATSR